MAAKRDEKGRWLPGQSPNPKGKPPRELSVTNAIRTFLDGPRGSQEHIKTLVNKLWTLAIAGDMVAIKYMIDRVDGTPTAKNIIETGDNPELKNIMDAFTETMRERSENPSQTNEKAP